MPTSDNTYNKIMTSDCGFWVFMLCKSDPLHFCAHAPLSSFLFVPIFYLKTSWMCFMIEEDVCLK